MARDRRQVPFDERGWSDRLSTKMSLRTTIHITPMEDAFAVSRDAGNSPVRFDVAGPETEWRNP
jgi:hypothetical protein